MRQETIQKEKEIKKQQEIALVRARKISATHALDGAGLTEPQIQLLARKIAGEITGDEYRKMILDLIHTEK